MKKLIIVVLLVIPNTTGCAGLIVASALSRNADRKETHEYHRHQERMKELDLQERLMNKQYPQVYPQATDAGIVREPPY
jgi:hypothetical protein